VLDGLNDVASTSFALGADHSGTLGDTTEGFAEVAAAANERHLVVVLGDVVDVVCGSKDFRLIDVVDTNSFEDLERIC
jgi:hypothetical protein